VHAVREADVKRILVGETVALGAIMACTARPSDFPLYWTGPSGEVFAGPAGDVNGDGVSDLILVSTATPSVAFPQQALVRSGLNGSLLHTWVPSVPGGWAFGVSTLEPAGDLDLDGFDDVVLAANTSSGAPSSVLEVRSGLDGSVIAIIPPLAISNGTWLSSNTAGVGDLDGDGLPELLVMGNHQVSVPGCMSYGQGVYNLEAPGFGLQYYQTSWQCAQELGRQLGRLDDVDGDGSADFYVGAARTDVAGVGLDAGWIGVFSGATGSAISSLNGSAPFQYLGLSVAALGDVNGDGMPEIAALRSTFNYVGYEVSVISLPSMATVYSVTSGSIGAFGIVEVDGLGDSDGDGLDDFLMRWASPQGWEAVTVVSGPTGAAMGQVAQGYPGGVLYVSGGVGDVNGDGLGDFATTPWTQLTSLPPIAVQGLWSPWSWPLTDGAARVYVSPNLRIVGTAAVGGTAQFQVVVPRHPARPFQLVFAQDYAFPAFPLGPFLFPLAPDPLFWASLGAGLGGTLNANGQGTVTVPIPNNPALQGAWFSASGFVYDPSGPLGIGCVLTQAGFQIP
jgi:hypothetical protein